jgi:hypothetical protein
VGSAPGATGSAGSSAMPAAAGMVGGSQSGNELPSGGLLPAAECNSVPAGTSCTSFAFRPGTCTAEGQCNEYCVVGQSLLGACALGPG